MVITIQISSQYKMNPPPKKRVTKTSVSVASPANEVLKQVSGQDETRCRGVCVCSPSEAVQRGLASSRASRLEETVENRRLIGTDGLDYGNDHGGARARYEERSFQASQRSRAACCSWTVLTPRKMLLQTWDLGGPPRAAC